ncbi:MAG: lamin tail domain-containing protein [bacterium]|nr:lamin tail domain-containing protein [bacterium]
MSSFCRTVTRGRRLLTVVLLAAGFLVAAAPVAPAAPADHLILSEIVVVANRVGAKYVEVVNPTGSAVLLDGVALTNGTNAGNDTGYWRVVETAPTSLTAGGGAGGTFHGAFPAGYSLAAGDTIAVAITGSGDFLTAYGVLPDFELFEDGVVPDVVPELVEIFPGSIAAGLGGGANAPDLSDVAGSVMLYRWDGVGNLAEDLDYFHWGTNDNFRVDKSGVTVGMDSYLADTDATTQQSRRVTDPAGDSFSFGRTSDEEGTEVTPGNGATGHDETSEMLVDTWEVDAQTPAAPPATHHAAAPIVTGFTVTPATPRDGEVTVVAVTAATPGAINGLTLHYQVDGGATSDVTGSDAGGGAWSASVPEQTEGAVVTWWVEVDNDGSASTVYPAGAPRFLETWTTDAPFVPGEGPDKLLLTEICTKGELQEFIEIHNPNTWDVDMSNYYLTDAVYYEQGYWNIGAGNPDGDSIGGGHHTSFQARFPDGYSIAAGDTIVVTVSGSAGFAESYLFLPDLELFEDDIIPDDVPDMRWVFGDANVNSIVGDLQLGYPDGTAPTLSNGGEPAILYYYEEGADLAVDIDMFVWGDGSSGRYQVDKSGITIGSSTYANDTPKGGQTPFLAEIEFGQSYQRVAGEDGNQTATGSNGIDGRNETSENWLVTFAMAVADPSRPRGAASLGGGSIELKVPARTFLPKLGEIFPIRFVSKPNSETKVRIFDQEGRNVITLFDSRFSGNPPSTIAGAYTTVVWDGRDDRYEMQRAGMYIVHLSVVDNETGDEETETAPVVMATRLSK